MNTSDHKVNTSVEAKAAPESWLFDNKIAEICTIGELAERLKISVSGLRKIIGRDAHFPKLKVGHQLRFRWDQVESHLRKGK